MLITNLATVAVDQNTVFLEVPDNPAFLVKILHHACKGEEGHETAEISGRLVAMVAVVPQIPHQGSRFQSDTAWVFTFLKYEEKGICISVCVCVSVCLSVCVCVSVRVVVVEEGAGGQLVSLTVYKCER